MLNKAFTNWSPPYKIFFSFNIRLLLFKFFQRIKETSKPEKAKLIPEFMTDLILVLIGYMYLSTSLEYLHKNQTLIPKFEKITSKTSKLFYQNGHKLAQKYLNEDHYLTKKFHNLLSHGIEGIESYIKPFGVGPQILQDSEETNVKNSFFLNPIESSFDRNSNNDDFFNKKQGKAFRLQTRKIFPNDIRAKSLNKLHSNEEDEEELESENYQIPYSALKSNKNSNKQNNPIYKRQMKEIEKTIKEMKKLKDKYQKNESTFFLQKNFELLLQQKELEDFISKRRDLQSSVIYPNTSQMFYMPQQQSNPVYAGLNKGQIDPTELLLQKQKEMEITLTNLQKEHFKILQDKEDKDKELDKLKNYVLKLEAEKISKELEKKIKNANNSKETKSVKVMNNELNIAPASSFNNLNESNLSDNSNKAKGRYSNPGDRKFKIPLDNVNKEKRKSIERNNEIKKEFTPTNSDNQESHLKRSHMMNNNNSNKINPSLTNLKKASSTSIKEEKGTTVLEKMIQEKVIQDKTKFEEKKTAPEKPKIRNQPSVTKLDRSNIQEKHILSDDKKPMEGNNDTDTITNQKPLNKRSESVRKILTEFKTSSLRQLNSDSLKKQDSLTSMDLALETINPSHLLRTILSSNHKSVIVRKKAFIDGKVFNFEFHILQENDTYIFKILCFYESNGKPAIKEELLQINLIRKILQNIDYRDVIPFIYPLKTIYNVLKFSRYFILPFLGIGDNKSVLSAEENNEKKVEIWPKAHGLIDKNIKVIFMGEEFFIFFHFLANDTFRLILSNAKK